MCNKWWRWWNTEQVVEYRTSDTKGGGGTIQIKSNNRWWCNKIKTSATRQIKRNNRWWWWR